MQKNRCLINYHLPENRNNMVTEMERFLIRCLTSKELGMRKEPCIVVMSLLQTEKQQGTMIDWIKKHYKENPSEDRIIEIAELINSKIK